MGVFEEDNILSAREQLGYEDALGEVETYFKNILFQFCLDNNIGVMVGSRIKDNDSLKNKIIKKEKTGISDVHDIAGLRIIFSAYENVCDLNAFKIFIDDILKENNDSSSLDFLTKKKLVNIYSILSMFDGNCGNEIILSFIDYIQNDGVYKIERVRDYVMFPKDNGYQSYQFVVKASNGYEVEIQVRNFLQHFWAELEHKFVYKDRSVSDDVRVFFNNTAGFSNPDFGGKQRTLVYNKQS